MAKTKKATKEPSKEPKPKKVVSDRESIFSGANSELISLAEKYKVQAISQSGGTAQRLNKASIELSRLARLFV